MQKCPTCNKPFLTSQALEDHKQEHLEGVTPLQKKQIVESILSGKGPLTAARIAGITPKELRKARQESPNFDESIRDAEAEVAERLEQRLFEVADAGDFRALDKWINTRNPDRWQPKADITVDIVHSIKELPVGERLPKIQALLEDRRKALALEATEMDILDVEVIDEVN